VLESFVTKQRDKSAALAFIKKALKRHGRFEKIATNGLRSYPAAMRELGNLDCHEMGRYHFYQERHLVDRNTYKDRRSTALAE
jgi:putative transposase